MFVDQNSQAFSVDFENMWGGNHNLMDKLTMGSELTCNENILKALDGLDWLNRGSMENLPTGVVFVFDPYPYTHGSPTELDATKSFFH